MDTVVIVLLVLGVIAIVLAIRGKPLWNNWAKPLWNNWAKPLWSGMKEKEGYLIISIFWMIFLVGIDTAFGHVCTLSALIIAVFAGLFFWETTSWMRGPEK